MTPKKLFLYAKGKQIERKNRDSDMFLWFGNYAVPAIEIGVRGGAWGKAKIEYPEKPIYSKETHTQDTERDIQKAREEFVLNMKIRKANWDLTHPKNETEV